MNFLRRQENFRRAAPDHHQARRTGLFTKLRDVFLDFERQIELRLRRFHVRAVEPLDVVAIERGCHWADAAKKCFGLREMFG